MNTLDLDRCTALAPVPDLDGLSVTRVRDAETLMLGPGPLLASLWVGQVIYVVSTGKAYCKRW